MLLFDQIANLDHIKTGDFSNASIQSNGLVNIGLRYNMLLAVQIQGYATEIYKDSSGYWYAYLTSPANGSHPTSGTVSGTYVYYQ